MIAGSTIGAGDIVLAADSPYDLPALVFLGYLHQVVLASGISMTDVSKFERVCRESNLAPVKKLRVGPRIVLIADGYVNDHPNFRGPHYTTLWAVGKDENHLEVARPLYFEGLGIVDRDTRIKAAEFDGIAFAEEMNARFNG